MKVCVVGAGAIGGILAAQLARVGHEVGIVARGAHLAAIQDQGLTLVDHARNEEATTFRVAACAAPSELADRMGAPETLFIGLKAHAIPDMLPRLEALVGPQTAVVPAINGVPWWYFQRYGGAADGAVVRSVDPHGTMREHLAPRHIVGCVVHAAGEVRAPGVVHYTGGKRFIIGEIDRGLADPHTERLRRLSAVLTEAGFEAPISADIRRDVWIKLTGNLAFNPVAALTESLIDQICTSPTLLGIVRPLLAESMAVARAFGVDIGMTPDERIALARQLGRAKISMHQDFEARRAPEVDAIVGAVLEMAERVDVPVPTIRLIDALVRARAVNLGLLSA